MNETDLIKHTGNYECNELSRGSPNPRLPAICPRRHLKTSLRIFNNTDSSSHNFTIMSRL